MSATNIARPRTVNFITIVSLLLLVAGSLLHFSRGTYYYNPSEGFPHVDGADDAYIAYRYGWNVANYGVLSWNESGFRRTEGFTDPLWVYVSALWSFPGNKSLVYPGMVLTSILVTASFIVGLSALILRRTRSTQSVVGLLLLCAAPVIWLHTTSGLESSAFGLGLALLAYYTITVDQIERADMWLANLLALLIILLRSDGFAYLVVLLVALLIGRRRSWWMLVPGALAGFVMLLVWRELSFGRLMPNTEVAKLNFGLAARILPGTVLFTQSMLNGGIVFVAAGLFGILSMQGPSRLAALTAIAGWSAYYVFIGGDLFLERHLISMMALSAAFSGFFFARVLQDRRGWALVGLLLIGLYVPFYIRDPRFQYLEPRPQDALIMLGKEMELDRPRYGTVVAFAAGKLPFFAGGDFVDELGLNDLQLALVRRPRFIPGHSAGDHDMAMEIARQSSLTYSYLGVNSDLTLLNAQDVLLWADNFAPQDAVHHGLTATEQEALRAAGPFAYSVIFRGR